MHVTVNRKDLKFKPDTSRVIARFMYTNDERSKQMIREVLSVQDDAVTISLSQILRSYSKRHRNISKIFENHFNKLTHLFDELNIDPDSIDINKKLLIGSYFTMEFSIESAALFNPSMVDHPDQTELEPGEKRVILSFRGTGEGHISSVVFRCGILTKDNNLIMEPVGNMLAEAELIKRFVYDKTKFIKKLDDLQFFANKVSPNFVLEQLGDQFTYGELIRSIEEIKNTRTLSLKKKMVLDQMLWLASSHYEIDFSMDSALSERVIFPIAQSEKKGIEDARFVKFTDDNGEITYYATYTAYDGNAIMPKLIETKDFYHFKVLPLHGEIAQNKGMALFPRKINGKFAMLCRIDGVNNYLAFSDDITIWRKAKLIQKPKFPWEIVQIGNCGSPIETKDGWLMIMHSVGPMREYVLSVSLFDLKNPEKELGRLKNPLIIPNEEEREGYVPNVVYSCGSILHNGDVVIPYAMSDWASTYATVNLKELLNVLKKSNHNEPAN
ncbi:MAG: glycoside hydrolase family 130 protein [Bacteroidales bacterium]|nr:glycoside hydrolase family 130 protein [Bacteroidales bacterium]